jgi:hypothetical protein
MSVCKYRAFIFLDQPPPWVSRTFASEAENDWRESVMKLAQAHDVSNKQLKWFNPLFTSICSYKRSWARGWPKCFTRIWRSSDCECVKWSWPWLPWLFDHLGQHSHCWWVVQQWRACWLASPSPKRPPRRSGKGCEKWRSGKLHRGAGDYIEKSCLSMYNCFILFYSGLLGIK